MAYSMAVEVAESPGRLPLNPLFIYGKSGLGKSHLMRAIQNYIEETRPSMRTVYVDAQDFVSKYSEAGAIKDQEKVSFRNFRAYYEQADILLLDDVQHLQGKKESMNMLFQLFNTLTSQGKQVVLSADRAPKNIQFDERLKSRFYSGGTMKLIQSRVTGGGYAGNGASTLDELDFTAQNLGNTDKGAAAGEVVIHELVHQWWGLGNMFDQMDQASAWSAEGLTVYTTYRISKELYGQAYAQQNYVDQWQQAVDDYYLNFYVRNPAYLDALPEQYRADIANSLAQVRQYSEMPLKILKAEQLVGGEQAMDEILHRLFNRELDWTYPYLTYQEFLDACGLTEEDLNLA